MVSFRVFRVFWRFLLGPFLALVPRFLVFSRGLGRVLNSSFGTLPRIPPLGLLGAKFPFAGFGGLGSHSF